MVFSFKHYVYNCVRENEENKKLSPKSSEKSKISGRWSETRSISSSKAKKGGVNGRSLIYWKQTDKQIEKSELQEIVAKSKAKVKVFEELEQPTTVWRST